MNAFADTLFTLLFGWVRSIAQGVWNAASSGKFASFFTWLGDSWLWVALLLCLVCTAVDYLIWLIRWRRYRLWRSMFHRFLARLRGKNVQEDRRFAQGYRGGVSIEMPAPAPSNAPIPDWEQELAFAQPAPWQENAPAPSAPAFQGAQIPPDEIYAPVPDYAAEEEARQHRYFSPPAEYTPPPAYIPSRADAAFSSDMPASRRKRRSEKYDHKRSWHERLIATATDEEQMLDGLPPAVDREQAFHEPVYPDRPAQPYAAWQKPEQENRLNG